MFYLWTWWFSIANCWIARGYHGKFAMFLIIQMGAVFRVQLVPSLPPCLGGKTQCILHEAGVRSWNMNGLCMGYEAFQLVMGVPPVIIYFFRWDFPWTQPTIDWGTPMNGNLSNGISMKYEWDMKKGYDGIWMDNRWWMEYQPSMMGWTLMV